MLEVDEAVVEVDACQWAVETRETTQINTAINHPLITKRTLLAWMIFVDLPTRVQAEPRVNKCRLDLRQCFRPEATVVVRWVRAVH